MPVIRLESPGSGLWSQMTWPQYPGIGLTHPCILRRDSCRALPHESRAPFSLPWKGNVGTPWRVRNKGAEFNPYIMASSCTLNTSRQRQSKRSCTELEASSQSDDDSPPVTDRWFVMQATDSEPVSYTHLTLPTKRIV